MANNQPYVCIINITGRSSGSEIQSMILRKFRADSNLTPESKINLIIKNNSSLQKIPKFSERVFKDYPYFLDNVTKLSLIDTTALKDIDRIDIFPNLEEINIFRDDRFPIKYYDISSFTRLPNLKKIGFKRIEFEIPGEFVNLNLEDLDFDNCVFKDNKYDEICGIVSLKRLMFNNTKFIPPENIDRLINLEEYYHLCVDLPYQSHEIKSPDSENHNLIFNLPKIKFVDFTGQKFVVNMDFRECETLEFLAIGKIDITPDERANLNEKLNGLSKFPNLIKLNLSALGIGILPRDINLEKIELLNLSFNHFVEIEEGILSNFPNLKSLILSDNILVSLPNDIGELRELESLFLYNNVELKEFPSSISNLTKLNKLELRGCLKLIAEIRDIAGSDVKEPQEIIKLFAPGCPLRSLLVRNFNNNKNGSYSIRQAIVRTKDNSNSPVDVNLSDNLQVELFDKNILGFFDQILNYFEDKGSGTLSRDFSLTQQDSIINGLFRVRLASEVGIDAGGLYRQLLSDLNKEIDEQKFFEVKDGTLTTSIEDSNRLKGIIGIILMLYNSGEGIFRSDFKFGHAINLFRETWAYRDVREDLEPVLKDFAINILNEDKDKVKLLTKEDERLNTYLWLMNEYIEEGFKVQEGSSCETVLNANTIKEYVGMYDYIFLEADWREPSFELDLHLPPGETLNTRRDLNQEDFNRRTNELRRRIVGDSNRNSIDNETTENRNAPANEVANANANEVAVANANANANEVAVANANANEVAVANANEVAVVNANANANEVAVANANEVAVAVANANEVAVVNANANANANEVAVAVANANEVAVEPEENRISGEEEFPDISNRFTDRDENWRNNPRRVSAFRRNVQSRRRENTERQENDNRIARMPYLDFYFRELYGDNWRNNRRTRTTFRRQVTQEARQNNEELARRNPERLDSVERAFGEDWRSSMPARRVLRGLTPYPRGRGPQRGGANNESTNIVEEIGRWASRTGEDPFTSETLPEDMRTFIQERGEELRDEITEQIRYFVQQREARERFMQRQTAAPILSSNSNSNDSERFSSQKESLYKIDPKIIEAFKFYTNRHDTNTSQFLNKKNKKYVEPNIFLIYHIFSPNDDIDVELFKEKIRFSESLPVTEKDIILETIDDHMSNISQEEESDLDTYVREESGGKLESFKLLIPNHRTFLTKFLEYWSGSMKLSEGTYRIFPRDGIVAMEAHTCFNELVLPRFSSKLDFLKLFVYSILTVGTTFGVAGRKLTKKGKKNKKKNEYTRQNKMTRKKRGKNRIDVSPDPGFKKIKSKRN